MKARKDYKCCLCGGAIPRGQEYEPITGTPRGGVNDAFREKAHCDCYGVATVLYGNNPEGRHLPIAPAYFFFDLKDAGLVLPLHAALEVRKWDECAEFSQDGKLLQMF